MAFGSRCLARRAACSALASVALIAAVLAAPGVAGAGPRGGVRSVSGCARVLFVGARGSGEYGPGSNHWPRGRDPGDPFGLGGPVNEAYHLISFGIGFRPVSVNYPAARVQTLFPHPATYFDSISIGLSFTLTQLIRAARPPACPHQPIVLAGFSQGAMVMHRVIQTLTTTRAYAAIAARIAAVVLIGDGDQIPSDNVTRFGTAKKTVAGIGLARPGTSHTSTAVFAAGLKKKVLQVCNADDVVCGWPDVKTAKKCLSEPLVSACSKRIALGIWVHLHYTHRKALIAAGRAAASLLAAALGKTRFGAAIEVPGLGALNTGGSADLTSVSCASPGNCAAGGTYTDSTSGIDSEQAFVASQVNGAWHDAMDVPGLAALNAHGIAGVTSVSCASPGNCAAGGWYTDSLANSWVFVASEVNGAWHDAIQVPGLAALAASGHGTVGVASVSCASPGNCAVGGSYWNAAGNQAFVASEVNGAWYHAVEVPGTAALNTGGNAIVNSVSCASPGNCSAGGHYDDNHSHWQAFVASEVNGAWQHAIELPGTAALNTLDAQVLSVSCASPGNCAAAGDYSEGSGVGHAFVASEMNGVWQDAVRVPGLTALGSGGGTSVRSVSCASPGSCAAGGQYTDRRGFPQAFVASEVNNAWQHATEVSGISTVADSGIVLSVSCASAGNCAAAGGSDQAFVASEVSGAWQHAVAVTGPPAAGPSGVASVSCGSPWVCAAGGFYYDRLGQRQAFVTSEQQAAS